MQAVDRSGTRHVRLTIDSDGAYTWHPDGTLDTYTPTTGPTETCDFDPAGRLAEITDGTITTGIATTTHDTSRTYHVGWWMPTHTPTRILALMSPAARNADGELFGCARQSSKDQ